MSELPIRKLDYDNVILLTDFNSKLRDLLKSNDTLKFTPLINGYKIDFVIEETQFTLLLDFNKKLKTELIVNVFVNEIAEKSFKSSSTEDNENIIKQLLN